MLPTAYSSSSASLHTAGGTAASVPQHQQSQPSRPEYTATGSGGGYSGASATGTLLKRSSSFKDFGGSGAGLSGSSGGGGGGLGLAGGIGSSGLGISGGLIAGSGPSMLASAGYAAATQGYGNTGLLMSPGPTGRTAGYPGGLGVHTPVGLGLGYGPGRLSTQHTPIAGGGGAFGMPGIGGPGTPASAGSGTPLSPTSPEPEGHQGSGDIGGGAVGYGRVPIGLGFHSGSAHAFQPGGLGLQRTGSGYLFPSDHSSGGPMTPLGGGRPPPPAVAGLAPGMVAGGGFLSAQQNAMRRTTYIPPNVALAGQQMATLPPPQPQRTHDPQVYGGYTQQQMAGQMLMPGGYVMDPNTSQTTGAYALHNSGSLR